MKIVLFHQSVSMYLSLGFFVKLKFVIIACSCPCFIDLFKNDLFKNGFFVDAAISTPRSSRGSPNQNPIGALPDEGPIEPSPGEVLVESLDSSHAGSIDASHVDGGSDHFDIDGGPVFSAGSTGYWHQQQQQNEQQKHQHQQQSNPFHPLSNSFGSYSAGSLGGSASSVGGGGWTSSAFPWNAGGYGHHSNGYGAVNTGHVPGGVPGGGGGLSERVILKASDDLVLIVVDDEHGYSLSSSYGGFGFGTWNSNPYGTHYGTRSTAASMSYGGYSSYGGNHGMHGNGMNGGGINVHSAGNSGATYSMAGGNSAGGPVAWVQMGKAGNFFPNREHWWYKGRLRIEQAAGWDKLTVQQKRRMRLRFSKAEGEGRIILVIFGVVSFFWLEFL